MRALALGLCSLLLLAPAGRPAACADAPLAEIKAGVLRAIDDKDEKRRAQAFLPLHVLADPAALFIAVEGAAKATSAIDKVKAEQIKAEQAYEKACTGLDQLEQAFEEKNDNSPRATEAFNKHERKLSSARDQAQGRLRSLEGDLLRAKALVDSAVVAAHKILGNLRAEDLTAGIDILEGAWLRSSQEVDALKYLDALGGLPGDEVPRRFAAAAVCPKLPLRVRSAAVDSLAASKDSSVVGVVVPFLELPREQFDLMAAAIRAIARAHRREGIAPLIAFLGREDKDIGRLRGDAVTALRSLTGETHGPYKDPWETWWKQAEAGFQMPPAPKPHDVQEGQGKGVTFYGIRTFSDRVLLILDISLSMEKPDQKGKAEPRRIDTAKKELTGAIHNVDDGDTFNVMLFNHSVIPWQAGMVVATEETRRKAATWVEGAEHIGGTNIHDALEAAFMLALRSTGEPMVDTVFFLTDGTPTAGKLQDPKLILEQVREWNRQANLQLHCIAVGEADHVFLQELARIGNGTFLQR